MRANIVVATKGRGPQVARLIVELAAQTRRPDRVVVVGATPDDIADIDMTQLGAACLTRVVSERSGAALQRNAGIDMLLAEGAIDASPDSFVAFLDDDFRPAPDWIEQAIIALEARPDALGFGGSLLLNEQDTSEETAAAVIARDVRVRSSTQAEPVIDGTGFYGCNMGARGSLLVDTRFDDGLPLYSWLEDADFSVKIRRRGPILYVPTCRGVHLNTAGGRTSGLRFGYSQVANPLYLARQGTMRRSVTLKLITLALMANVYHVLRPREGVDHLGRLRGNVRALADMARRRDRPDRILDMKA